MPKVDLKTKRQKQDLRFKELVAGKRAVHNLKIGDLARAMHYRKIETVTRHINSPDGFKLGDIRTLVAVLGITPEELVPLIW